MAASRDIGRPRGSQTGQKSRLLSDELRELGMDDELWARVENQRALTKLIKRGEIDRARERIVRLRELVADDSQDAARASATDAFVEEQQAALETVRNGASFEATVVDGPLVDEAAREVASGVVAAVDERIAQLSAEDAQLQKVKLEWLRVEGERDRASRRARGRPGGLRRGQGRAAAAAAAAAVAAHPQQRAARAARRFVVGAVRRERAGGRGGRAPRRGRYRSRRSRRRSRARSTSSTCTTRRRCPTRSKTR